MTTAVNNNKGHGLCWPILVGFVLHLMMSLHKLVIDSGKQSQVLGSISGNQSVILMQTKSDQLSSISKLNNIKHDHVAVE